MVNSNDGGKQYVTPHFRLTYSPSSGRRSSTPPPFRTRWPPLQHPRHGIISHSYALPLCPALSRHPFLGKAPVRNLCHGRSSCASTASIVLPPMIIHWQGRPTRSILWPYYLALVIRMGKATSTTRRWTGIVYGADMKSSSWEAKVSYFQNARRRQLPGIKP
jgi:hypothetical protein